MKQLSGGWHRPKYRLSPNEVEQLKKEETERRRKLRIVQVREQSKAAAAKIRQNVKQERNRQLVKLAHEVQNELEAEKQEEVRKLEKQYDNTLRTIGQGHTQAMITDRKVSNAEKEFIAYENKQRADERHKEALRKVALDKAYKEYEETKPFRDRQAALVEEKKRAAEVAARPPPPPDPIAEVLRKKQKQKRPVPMTDMNAFSSTHYHIPDFAVEKAPTEQQIDGKAAGEEEDQRTKEEISERHKKEHDQLIRARIRGNEALKKEMLKHDYDALMADLSLQQRADRRQRQLVVSTLPKQVFLPPERRMEELEDKQMQMERAFEDMYMKQMNLSGNLSLTLDPNPMPNTPADESLEAAESPAIIIPAMPSFNPALRELTNVSRTQGQTVQQGKPETVLKKLLTKIKEQRSEIESERTQAAVGQENLESKSQKKDMGDAEPDFTTARQPVHKPAADPQLDLSPMKVPGNQKPQKQPDPDMDEDSCNATSMIGGSEAVFLDQLQDRLQAIEAQKQHLDKLMRERQQQQQMLYSKHAFTGVPPSSASQGPGYGPAASAGSQPLSQAPATTFFPGQWTITQPQGPAGDIARTTDNKPDHQRDSLFTQPHSASSAGYNLSQSTGVSNAALGPASEGLIRPGQRDMSLGSGHPHMSMNVSELSTGQSRSVSGFPQSSLSFPHSISWGMPAGGVQPSAPGGLEIGSEMRGTVQPQTAISSVQPHVSSMYPHSAVGSVPFGSSATVSLTAGPMTVGGVQAQSSSFSMQPPTLTSQMYSRGLHPASQLSMPTLGLSAAARTGDNATASASLASSLSLSQSSKPAADFGSLASRLAAGLSEQERLQHLRNYQQQLIQKHQERMKALQETRASIETRQAQPSGQGLSNSLSASQHLSDPAALVPYTLKTSVLQPESSSGSFTSTSATLPVATAVPLSSSIGSFAPMSSAVSSQVSSKAHEAVRLSSERGVGHVPLGGTGLLSSVDSAGALAVEPVLAGSSGVTITGQQKRQSPAQASYPSVLTDGGDMLRSSRTSGSTKLDSVRKSLPFDNLDDTPYHEGAEGDVLDIEGNSMADDSHMSSSTERGSPALGSRSNKSSTSGKSGSGMSAMSDGSLGGSSLVARAEEKRIGFEQRQRELQDQLAEIQRQKDALLQRYHGNQQRVSTQEETLRSKLKTAKAIIPPKPSSAPPSLMHQPVTAVGLGIHQSASPSMELEEGSLSSERLSTGKSWAMELEEYSISKEKSGEGTFKSPGSMTLEEFSITSDRSGGAARDAGKVTERSATEVRPGSSLSSLEEYSIVSGSVRQSVDDVSGSVPLVQSARGSEEKLSARYRVTDSGSGEGSGSARGQLDIRDLLHDLGGGGQPEGITWSEVLASGQSQQQDDTADADSARLPPPPTRQPVAITDYEPHELSTILEVDTPQTGAKNTVSRVSPPASGTTGGEGTDKTAARRYIDFNRHGTVSEDDRESKFSASGSSASSDVRSVIEVRSGTQKSGETLSTAGSAAGESTFSLRGGEQRFRENILESSSMKGVTGPHIQGSLLQDFQPSPSQEVSYASSGQGFHSLELTQDSLTPRSVSVEESQARQYMDISGKESAGQKDGEHVDDVLRQARQFNQDLMAAIHRQSADVFDQSSVSTLSHTAADNSQASQQ